MPQRSRDSHRSPSLSESITTHRRPVGAAAQVRSCSVLVAPSTQHTFPHARLPGSSFGKRRCIPYGLPKTQTLRLLQTKNKAGSVGCGVSGVLRTLFWVYPLISSSAIHNTNTATELARSAETAGRGGAIVTTWERCVEFNAVPVTRRRVNRCHANFEIRPPSYVSYDCCGVGAVTGVVPHTCMIPVGGRLPFWYCCFAGITAWYVCM